MTILITVLLTLLAIIVIACVIAIFLAPMRITLRFDSETEIGIDFGRYMKNMWSSIYWFSISRDYFNSKGEVEYSVLFYHLFTATEKQINKLNKKLELERMEKEIEYIDHE